MSLLHLGHVEDKQVSPVQWDMETHVRGRCLVSIRRHSGVLLVKKAHYKGIYIGGSLLDIVNGGGKRGGGGVGTHSTSLRGTPGPEGSL